MAYGGLSSWTRFWTSPNPSSTTSTPARTPDGVSALNDSLYELSSPFGGNEVDIVFFHGLQPFDYTDAYWKTWSSDGTTIWPRDFFRKSLLRARILSVSYDSCASKSATTGRGDFFTIGENLVQDIILDELEGGGVGRGNRPVILVGHSLGGLLIKQFVQTAQTKRNEPGVDKDIVATIDTFLSNLSGIFYYATPHQGSELGNLLNKVPQTSDVVTMLKLLSKETTRLNDFFRKWRKEHGIPAETLFESHKTSLWGLKSIVIVDEASAREDSDSYYAVAADHIRICKPDDMSKNSFRLLLGFVKKSTLKKKGITLTEATGKWNPALLEAPAQRNLALTGAPVTVTEILGTSKYDSTDNLHFASSSYNVED